MKDDMEVARAALAGSIARWTERGELHTTAVPRLALFRRNEPSETFSGTYDLGIGLVLQGAIRVTLGGDTYVYDPYNYLLTALHLCTVAKVTGASREKPYLGLALKFDLHEITQLMADSHLPPPRRQQSSCGMGTGKVTLPLLNAFQRMVDLLDTQEDIAVLAPLIHREILYRLLVGDQGARLRQIASVGTQSQQIARVVEWLRIHFAETLHVDDLATKAGMSTSTFHHHFRSMTTLSPLQYQKKLRLQEARNLMLNEHLDAANAGFQVGYESPSQFSREYKRMFGAPPLQDITKLREISSA